MTSGNNVDLAVTLGRLELDNPVIAASGTFGYGLEYRPFVDLNRLGGFATKGLSMRPRFGNPVPRMVETASGMLNAIGLENIGLEKFLSEKLPVLQSYNTRIIVNFFGDTRAEYIEMAAALSDVERVDALEMNISCPNVEEGGVQFSSDPTVVHDLVEAVRKATGKFLIVKLSPNVTDITAIAKAAEDGGADALSLINTQIGMSIDLETGKPWLANQTGGLSGPAIKPIALQMVYKTVRAVKTPVIGIGGISNTEDALEFLAAGATAIQIGTANFIDPAITMKVVDGIRNYCQTHGIQRVDDLKLKED
ncbi:MAG: dihydroorotate dehydrogenase B (NAD(+)), catalytic subunit [Nitrospinaceae bacterium]|nr:MAG: dihydroorotate dehydrogenase B (NAD(+)), catalytic subunit [Nitrospinaceae bacterium]